ncbi:MAG TPA: hypothetical protein PK074_09510, partial [Spirochaetales bacterium]|nr:hypothetical protein [Spirochaetales bacterium]HPD80733.1 hypothetical protein [Spirochaetales bacterium]HQK34950.1 hypothetical protein [Spirochaetales bacterium]
TFLSCFSIPILLKNLFSATHHEAHDAPSVSACSRTFFTTCFDYWLKDPVACRFVPESVSYLRDSGAMYISILKMCQAVYC